LITSGASVKYQPKSASAAAWRSFILPFLVPARLKYKTLQPRFDGSTTAILVPPFAPNPPNMAMVGHREQPVKRGFLVQQA
jgi:hypothetical protein